MSAGEPRLRLLLDGQRLLSVRERTGQLMTKRSRCKCDDADQLRLPICGCGDHEAALRSIIIALERWEKAERDFFLELCRERPEVLWNHGRLSTCRVRT
jgi:hypothetical protein